MRIHRGKIKGSNRWVEGYLLVCGVTDKNFILPTGNIIKVLKEGSEIESADCIKLFAYEVIPETVGQCSGLPDRNENMIFAGDIVKFDNDKLGYVVYDEDETEFGIVYDENIYCGLGRNYIGEALEVVGNIYDNPIPI